MTKDHLETILDDFYKKRKEIRTKKGQDYANEDTLSNFKLAGNIIGLKPEMQILSLIATKVARLGNLIGEEKKANNESVEDSVLDLTNYCELLYATMREESVTGCCNNKIEGSKLAEKFREAATLHYKAGDSFNKMMMTYIISRITDNTVQYKNSMDGFAFGTHYEIPKDEFEKYLKEGSIKITHRFVEPDVFP